MPSGVGTMSREFVLGTCHYYNWVQLGSAINHPDMGKKLDLSKAVEEETGIKDPSIMIYPYNNYGDENILRTLLEMEKPDAILHFTDPRFWIWLYQMEHEIRTHIPLLYYTIWDDLPYPRWNESFYESCDLLMSISKQTYGIVKNTLEEKSKEDWQLTYVPHGINETVFYPIRIFDRIQTFKQTVNNVETDIIKKDSELVSEFKTNFFGKDKDDVDFVILYVNRNIRRKSPGDVVLAYKEFCDMLTPEQSKRCALIMHTQPIDDNGTDLYAVVNELCPYRVVFSSDRLQPMLMNIVFNIADVTINIASNEGFGLGTCESLMSGTPIVVNVTGGLQDQCGFKLNGKYLTEEDYVDIMTLHDRDEWKNNKNLTWGEWVHPVWPSNRSLQGSPPTPYIFDDRADYKETANKIKELYDLGKEKRNMIGELGRGFVTDSNIGMSASEMSRRFIFNIETTFEKWKPREKFSITRI